MQPSKTEQLVIDQFCQNCLWGKHLSPPEINEVLSYPGKEIWDLYCEIHNRDTWGGAEDSILYGLECYEIKDSLGRSVWIGVLLDANADSESETVSLPTIHACLSELFLYHGRYGFVVVLPEMSFALS